MQRRIYANDISGLSDTHHRVPGGVADTVKKGLRILYAA